MGNHKNSRGKIVFCKIDYDFCYAYGSLSEKDYERDLLTKTLGHVTYKDIDKLKREEQYLTEKLYARLKLALLPRQLFEGLVKNKEIIEEKEIQSWVGGLCDRANTALGLFCKHPKSIGF